MNVTLTLSADDEAAATELQQRFGLENRTCAVGAALRTTCDIIDMIEQGGELLTRDKHGDWQTLRVIGLDETVLRRIRLRTEYTVRTVLHHLKHLFRRRQ